MKQLWIILAALLIISPNAFAHCDTMAGPTIKDAQLALEKGDVTPTLKWVPAKDEAVVREAFASTLKERGQNKEADKRFFETLVRIHRASEGAEFEGIKDADAVAPVERMADEAIDAGSADDLLKKMTAHISRSVGKRFDKVMETRRHKDESVEAGREFVAAYVDYVHFVEGIHKAASAEGAHAHGEAAHARPVAVDVHAGHSAH